MRVSTCHSTGRTEVGVFRLLDGERRSVTILCPWGQSLAETLRQVRHQLTPEEYREVADAFDLDPPEEG